MLETLNDEYQEMLRQMKIFGLKVRGMAGS